MTEVTLLGQNVNSYGRDLPKGQKTTFAELLALADAVDGIDRVRYTSPHPKDMKEDVLRAHAELPSVCEHIHLPLQAGSSRILKAMRRTYDKQRYLDRVAMIREHVPDVALTTDIIVGFPGETEEEFEETLEVVEAVGYDSAFTFIFSPRRGTEAAELDGQLLARRSSASGWSGWSSWCSAAPPSARSGSSAARWTCWSRAPRAPTPTGCAVASATTRPSTSAASRSRASTRGWRSSPPPPPRWRARRACCARGGLKLPDVALFGPTGVGKTAVALAVAELLRERGEDPVAISADALQVYAGLETLTGARPRATGWSGILPGLRDASPRASTPRARTRRSTPRWRRGGGRSWSAAPASTCRRR